jgi:hypothetical protein
VFRWGGVALSCRRLLRISMICSRPGHVVGMDLNLRCLHDITVTVTDCIEMILEALFVVNPFSATADFLRQICLWCCFSLVQWCTQEFFFGGGGSTNSVEDRGQRERGSGGGNPLVRGSGGSCNVVQEISFHMVKFS